MFCFFINYLSKFQMTNSIAIGANFCFSTIKIYLKRFIIWKPHIEIPNKINLHFTLNNDYIA